MQRSPIRLVIDRLVWEMIIWVVMKSVKQKVNTQNKAKKLNLLNEVDSIRF